MEEGEFKKVISGKRVKVERIALEPRVLKRLSEIDILINCREKDKNHHVKSLLWTRALGQVCKFT